VKMRILVVEDSEDIRELLGQLLESEGYEFFLAADGQKGLDQAHFHQPDLIFMDMSLPVMTGWEAVRHLRQEVQFKNTPIIAMTAHASKADEDRAMQVGCTAYISKPFDVDKVLEYVSTYNPHSNPPAK